MFDLIIKNGVIVDGTGKRKPVPGSIAVKGGEIVEVGKISNHRASQVVDAAGHIVSPGFIDIQNHSDAFWSIFDYPSQESMLTQGITTISLGHCGASLAPLPSLEAFKSIQKWRSLEGQNFNWLYFDEFLKELSKRKLGVNVLSLVGHSTIRRGLLGDETRKVSQQEIKIMDRLLASSYKNGAFGISFGLVYAHEFNAAKEELESLSKISKEAGKLVSVHLRSEGGHILEALDEALHLAEKTGASLKISHFKVKGESNWDLQAEAIEKIERAYAKGVKISFDVYPYTSSWSVLYTFLPKWAYEGGRAALGKRLQEPYLRNRMISSLDEQGLDFSKVIVATASSRPHLVGRTLVDIASDQGVKVNEAILNLLASSDSEVIVFEENISESNLETLLKHPLSMVATDGAGFTTEVSKMNNLVHPRCFGAMPRFLSMVHNKKLMSIQEAVHKITGRPAEVLRLNKRGLLAPGYAADLVILSEKEIKDLATLSSPEIISHGIKMVVLGGKIAAENGAVTNPRLGKVLKE